MTSEREGDSFSLTLKHANVFRTQPIRYVFRAPTGRETWIRKKRTSPYYTFLYGQRGTVCVQTADRRFPLTPHSFLLLAPNCPFGLTAQEHANVSFLAIEAKISPEEIVPDFVENGFVYLENVPLFDSLFNEILSLSSDRYAYGEALLLTIFERIRDMKAGKSNPETLYRRALAFIRRHIADPPTSALIAFGTQYSADHLSKLLKSSHGLSLSALIGRERLQTIKNYLRFTSYEAERIASILAFSSPSAMLSFFRYHTGMTPNEYRKKFQGTESALPRKHAESSFVDFELKNG